MEEAYKETVEFLNEATKIAKDLWDKPYVKEFLLVLLIAIILLIVIAKIRKHFAPIRLFNNSAGVVSVTPSALNELVQSVCYSIGTTNRPSVKIYEKRGRLCMIVAIKLEMGQKLADVSATLQDELTNACREHLGVEKLGRIDVRIKGFKGILKKSPREDEQAETPTQETEKINDPFSG